MAATHKRLKVMTNHDDLPPLDSLEKRISEARRVSSPEPEKRVENKGKGAAFRSGTELIAGIAVGGFLGYFADDWLGTRPALTIAGIFFGLAGSVMNIYRAVSAEAAQTDDHADGDSTKPDRISED